VRKSHLLGKPHILAVSVIVKEDNCVCNSPEPIWLQDLYVGQTLRNLKTPYSQRRLCSVRIFESRVPEWIMRVMQSQQCNRRNEF
jgi:hypothetical protein